ncbi:MAG: coproporphyrinogen III oxidase family protein [Bacteroidaceae bacterium]|nr:coproporphyrinogen III oxidase family protein [Bacteroidaceae bacterium]
MAGLYIHIPFCKSRCIYCDFYSTTQTAEMADYVSALCREIRCRRHELAGVEGLSRVRTIYIGGGTPSLLTPRQLAEIFQCIQENYVVEADAEVTVEMNPEDVVRMKNERMKNEKCGNERVKGEKWESGGMKNGRWKSEKGENEKWKANRVSLGIQTFDEELLRLLRRRHTAQTAVRAVRELQDAGFANISIDLIYGLPGQTMKQWEHDLDVAFSLGIQHLSAYALSYETATPLWQLRQQGRVEEVEDELSVAMYRRLCERARQAGFEHYEISNFALPGFYSRHNSSYWTGEAYLGFGPGAHSFDGVKSRRANEPDLAGYLESHDVHFSIETLSDDELYDEAVMCGLRTAKGINLYHIEEHFGVERRAYLLRMAAPHLRAGRLVEADGHLLLSEQALMISDSVMSDLMA